MKQHQFLVFCFLALVSLGCTRSGTVESGPPAVPTPTPAPATMNQAYRSIEQGGVQRGKASYYGKGFDGKKTASGETYNMNEDTAAHRTLPIGTKVEVKNLENGKTKLVRINDRGPYKKGRVIDLSKGAADDLGLTKDGVAPVELKVVEGAH